MGIATMEGMEIARGSRRALSLLMQDSPPLHQRWRGGQGVRLCEYSPFTLVYDHARATAFHMPHITLQGIINGDAGAAPCLAKRHLFILAAVLANQERKSVTTLHMQGHAASRWNGFALVLFAAFALV